MKLLYMWLLMLTVQSTFAQQDYYVFIQQPSGQPFYVRMGEESYSSSAKGHIILSPMKDSLYDMYIGFPQSTVPEQLFRVQVEKKDRGFELKQFDGRWQLQDIENKQLVRSAGRVVHLAQGVKRTDSYSHLMAGVVNDTAVLYIDSMAYADTSAAAQKAAAARKENSRVVIDSLGKQVDSAAVRPATNGPANGGMPAPAKGKSGRKDPERVTQNRDSAVQTPVLKDSAVSASPAEQRINVSNGGDPRDIIRYRTENVAEGRLMIYVDRSGPVADTIRIIVPR